MKRTARRVAGWSLVVLGVVGVLTPIPGGVVLLALGAPLLLGRSDALRRAALGLRRRFPRGSGWLNRRGPGLPRALRGLVRRTCPRRQAGLRPWAPPPTGRA
jgi:hypothetical protein